MSNDELLKRVGDVMEILAVAGLSFDDRIALAHRVEIADEFSDLPENDRRAVLAAEKIKASGLTTDEMITLFLEEQLKQTQQVQQTT